jgi:pimeloyl-ACP methyl ester carboxylesterase
MKQIYKNNLLPAYRSEGTGSVIVLIHGFMESKAIWTFFSSELAKSHRVLSVDLPGHGESELLEGPGTIEKYAEAIHLIFKKEGLKRFFIVGHSMGGYVALAYAELYPDYLSGLCMFHSTPFSDSDAKKKDRQATIEQIKQGNLSALIKRHFNTVFAEANTETFQQEIEEASGIAGQMKEEAVIASIEAMAMRKDRSELMFKGEIPVLFIAGKEDRLISVSVTEQIRLPEKSEIRILEHSGHMGMIEERGESLKILRVFASLCK